MVHNTESMEFDEVLDAIIKEMKEKNWEFFMKDMNQNSSYYSEHDQADKDAGMEKHLFEKQSIVPRDSVALSSCEEFNSTHAPEWSRERDRPLEVICYKCGKLLDIETYPKGF